MTEYYIAIIVGVIQIILSVNLILRQKNGIAILSEILSSIILLYMLNEFSIELSTITCNDIALTFVEYIFVKIFLIIFMIIARIYCFNEIKGLWSRNKKNKKKVSNNKLKILRKFSKVKYWPKLKLGLASMADKRHGVTKVKFDEKGFPKFKSYYTVKLRRRDFKKTREQHFYIANKELYKKIQSNSRIREKFPDQEIKEFSQGRTPKKYTWHHHQDAGVLQLVEYEIHSKTSHIGGYSIWGSK